MSWSIMLKSCESCYQVIAGASALPNGISRFCYSINLFYLYFCLFMMKHLFLMAFHFFLPFPGQCFCHFVMKYSTSFLKCFFLFSTNASAFLICVSCLFMMKYELFPNSVKHCSANVSAFPIHIFVFLMMKYQLFQTFFPIFLIASIFLHL